MLHRRKRRYSCITFSDIAPWCAGVQPPRDAIDAAAVVLEAAVRGGTCRPPARPSINAPEYSTRASSDRRASRRPAPTCSFEAIRDSSVGCVTLHIEEHCPTAAK